MGGTTIQCGPCPPGSGHERHARSIRRWPSCVRARSKKDLIRSDARVWGVGEPRQSRQGLFEATAGCTGPLALPWIGAAVGRQAKEAPSPPGIGNGAGGEGL